MRVSIEYRTSSRDTYDRFCQENPNISIGYTEWCNILYTFAYNFRDYILETGNKARMPHGLGDLAISKKKCIRTYIAEDGTEYISLPVDWKKTKAMGKKIYHMNYHTEGFRFKWKWFPYSARFYRSDIWNFKPSRVSSRTLTHYISQGSQYHQKYKEWHLIKS